MGDELVFYTNPMSRGRIVRWMLEEVGAPYRTEIVDYGPPMKSPDYLAINPMGKVPTLRHGDTIVTECAAICAYLADVFPQAGLAPPPHARGAYYRWLFFGAGPLEAAVTDRRLGVDPSADQQPMVGYGSYDAMLDMLENGVGAGGYLAWDRFTAADVYIGASLSWSMYFGTIERRPAFDAYCALVQDRDAFRRAMAIDDAAAPAPAD